jgi:hypothetical protein
MPVGRQKWNKLGTREKEMKHVKYRKKKRQNGNSEKRKKASERKRGKEEVRIL